MSAGSARGTWRPASSPTPPTGTPASRCSHRPGSSGRVRTVQRGVPWRIPPRSPAVDPRPLRTARAWRTCPGHRAGGRHRRCGGRGPRGAGVGGCHVRSGGPRLGGVDRAYARVLVVSRQPRPPGSARRPGAGEPLVPRGSGRSRPAAPRVLRYPAAGTANPEVTAHVVALDGRRTRCAPAEAEPEGHPEGEWTDPRFEYVTAAGWDGHGRTWRCRPGPAHRPDGGGRSGHGRDAPLHSRRDAAWVPSCPARPPGPPRGRS